MPHLRIETNVKSSDIKDMDSVLKEFSKALAATTGKPEGYMMVHIVPDQHLIYGGSSEPCANAYFMCIGKMGVEENKKHAANIYPLVEKHLGVKDDRMYIFFQEAKTSEVGFKGTTFQQIMG
uniref:L-dopachrome isomerase n=1 Tax=Pseudodiaptomus poplesia TaxID=213370 RepID=A0A0U2VCH4_9MAXI|nr:macrophage migration inhibitory factor [Pseudodiaptomus poplesia]